MKPKKKPKKVKAKEPKNESAGKKLDEI
jgi:hypothetical protein